MYKADIIMINNYSFDSFINRVRYQVYSLCSESIFKRYLSNYFCANY